MSRMSQRQAEHFRLSGLMRVYATEHGSEAASQYRVAEALHELGATFALSLENRETDSSEIEELAMDIQALSDVAEAHQDAIGRAVKGQAPWGEILAAGKLLRQALDKILTR